MSLATVAAGFLAGAGLIIAIGAQNAFVLRQGLERSHVNLVVAICALSDIVLIVLGVAGTGALVQQWPALLEALRFAGAAFLALYGGLAARRAWQAQGALAAAPRPQRSVRQVALTCLAFTWLNPHVYLDTMVLLGSLSTRYPGALRWAFAGGASLASVSWFIGLGHGARLLQPVFRDRRAWRVLDACIAVFMFALAALLALKPLR